MHTPKSNRQIHCCQGSYHIKIVQASEIFHSFVLLEMWPLIANHCIGSTDDLRGWCYASSNVALSQLKKTLRFRLDFDVQVCIRHDNRVAFANRIYAVNIAVVCIGENRFEVQLLRRNLRASFYKHPVTYVVVNGVRACKTILLHVQSDPRCYTDYVPEDWSWFLQ